MSDPVEDDDIPKSRSWIYLVAIFVVLVAVGIVTS